MAIGQLADYARLVDPAPRRALLVPQKPRPDLIRLAASQHVDVIRPEGAGYATSAPTVGTSG